MSLARLAWVAAKKDLRRRLVDPAALGVWIGVPLLIAGLMALASSGGAPKARLLVADRDEGLTGKLLAGAAERAGDLFDVVEAEEAEGRARMEAGEASALVVLPEGLLAAVLDGKPARIELVTNPAERILPQIARGFLEVLREGAFYLQRLLDAPLERLRAQTSAEAPPSEAEVAELAVLVHRRLRELDTVLFPPRLSFESEIITEPSALEGGYGLVVLPGILLMAMLFVAHGMSEDLWVEWNAGTLRRALAAPHGATGLLVGKWLAGVMLAGVVAAVTLLALALYSGVPLLALPAALAWCLVAASALYSLFLAITVHASSPRGANLVGMLVLFPLMMLGGSFFPFALMPEWMVSLGRVLPNGIAVVQLDALLRGDLDPAALGRAALALVAYTLVALLSARRRLRGRFITG